MKIIFVNSVLNLFKNKMNQENFVIDNNSRKIAVQIPIKTYEKLLADSEELDDIKEYRKANAQQGNAIPFKQAFREIEEAVK
jgi:hypothetical protein